MSAASGRVELVRDAPVNKYTAQFVTGPDAPAGIVAIVSRCHPAPMCLAEIVTICATIPDLSATIFHDGKAVGICDADGFLLLG